MAFAGLVLNISRQYFFIREALCHSGGVCQVAATIVAHVDNQAVRNHRNRYILCCPPIWYIWRLQQCGSLFPGTFQ